MKNQLIFIIFCILIITNQLFSRENLKFNHLSIDDGLSQNSINCIIQDQKGYIWIGTQDGLNKYNGYDFRYYKNDSINKNSIGENHIYCFVIDKEGIMWIGTRGYGLDRFDLNTETFKHYVNDPGNKECINNNFVKVLFDDNNGSTLWIGTEGGGLNKFDKKTETFIKYINDENNPESISSNNVKAIYRDKKGSLWIGTEDGGLCLMNEKSGKFISFKNDPRDKKTISDNVVYSIFEDSNNRLWVGTKNGLNLFNRDTKTFKVHQSEPSDPFSLSNNCINTIFEDNKKRLWIGTEGGLNLFDYEKEKFNSYTEQAGNKYSLSNNSILSIYEDNIGTLWIGTYTGGLNKLTDKKFVHIGKDSIDPNTMPQNSVWALYQDSRGILWIGTESEGLCKFDRKKNIYTTYQNKPKDNYSISSNNIQTIFEDSKGRLWIGTADGLNYFDREKNKFIHFKHDGNNPKSIGNDDIMKIIEDTNGYLWIATYNGGADKFNYDKKEFIHYVPAKEKNSISHKRIRTVFEDMDGVIWFGTENGLNKYNQASGQFTLYSQNSDDPDCISHNRVFSICEDQEGIIWVTTKNGLNKLDKNTGKFKHYSEKDGLANNTIYSILEDNEGNLWMSSNNGISMLNPKNGIVKNFNVDDGLQSNEFNMGAYYKNKEGEMFFGGIAGINYFFPDKIQYNVHIPPIVLTSFRKFDKVIMNETVLSKTDRMKLSYKDGFFAFEFSALDFVAPNKNQYAYKMEGFDKDWIYCGTRRYVSYTNLNGGKFTFRVKGSNNDGAWNEKGTSIELNIPPPPWRTWWAYCLYVIVVLGLFFAYITRKKMQHEREMKIQKKINDAANRFVPYEYLAILGKPNILDVELGDQVQKDMTIFFSDIRSFTSISEKMSPKENIDFINDYLSRVGPVVRNNRGFIDKYIGDAVMALFEKDPDDAINAAIDSLKALDEFNKYRKEKNQEPIKIGIGINTGTLMLGTIGEHNRIDGTVISDAVNLASRIEGQTKNYGVAILITEFTYNKLKGDNKFMIRPIDKIQVKGKNQTITTYEVFNGSSDTLKDYKLSILDKYKKAYTLYYQKQFIDAKNLFKECYSSTIEDNVIRFYIERCEHNIKSPPDDNWDGVTTLKFK